MPYVELGIGKICLLCWSFIVEMSRLKLNFQNWNPKGIEPLKVRNDVRVYLGSHVINN